uniref:DNA-directed RNA polymerase subunit 5 n=1 Tax=Pithovirus LCPAC406 TaxID=2506599 RepID=A0A481ZD03_9VIRU|nr:MAG: DNA-directed RNA polymerase subunit 5 [Pithovirus LCPAC406]
MNEIYKVKYYQLAMLRNQGYNTDVEDRLTYFERFEEKGMLEEFIEANHILSRRYISKLKDEAKYCYYVKGKIAKDDVTAMKREVGNTSVIILISKDGMTPVALTELIDLTSKGYRFVTFKFAELSFDLFKNYLVPLHRKLSRTERKELIKKSGISLDQLPRITDQDPAVKRIDAQPGDVVKIYRRSNLHNSIVGKTVAYRLVVYQLPEDRAALAKKIKISI